MYWLDGNPSEYRWWADGYPQYQDAILCVGYSAEGFQDKPCVARYYYICKKPAGPSSFIIINFICQHNDKTDSNKQSIYNVVKYVEQDREAQKCSYLGPKQNRN